MTVRILQGDCREVLATLPDESVHCCVTSPPYFGLRDYGVDGQIGLEQTPDAYVAEMVAVFREVRRVLRDDGTLWLNLGDSYASSTKGNGGTAKSGLNAKKDADGALHKESKVLGQHMDTRRFDLDAAGLKPKDLIGIPWRVAFALQQPYYAGRIKSELDRIWLAAMIDGEGCMFIHKRKVGQSNGQGYERKSDSYGAGLEVANTHPAILERCQQITGVGSICRQDKDRRQPLYRWNVRSNECRWIVQEVYPHLIAKQHQARLLLGCPPSGERADAAHQALIGLHGGTPTDVDFKPPESLFQPGYYLRQDVIWSKLNPMPESVRDRCTKAHEYVFLLSKSPRYYFNAEAIAEPSVDPVGSAKRYESAFGGEKARAPVGDAGIDTRTRPQGMREFDGTRNKRSVWTIATQPFSEAHFATMAPELAETCIDAGCPQGGTVLDPFGGAGTTGLVADRLQRDAILIELNPDYAAMAEKRIRGDAPLFADICGEGA